MSVLGVQLAHFNNLGRGHWSIHRHFIRAHVWWAAHLGVLSVDLLVFYLVVLFSSPDLDGLFFSLDGLCGIILPELSIIICRQCEVCDFNRDHQLQLQNNVLAQVPQVQQGQNVPPPGPGGDGW